MSDPKPLLPPLRPAEVEPRLWTAHGFLEDVWRILADDEAMPTEGRLIVSLARWRTERPARTGASSGKSLGIALQPHERLDPAADDIGRLALIALVLPKFTDGRAYSTARRLREQWRYCGELRARGDILLDQIPLLLRCGFDTFEITHAATIRRLERGPAPAITKAYQGPPTGTGAWHSRRSPVQRDVAAE
jgi:phosphoadenosine phosphosulfate reductase